MVKNKGLNLKKDINAKDLKDSIGAEGIKLLLEYIKKQRKKIE